MTSQTPSSGGNRPAPVRRRLLLFAVTAFAGLGAYAGVLPLERRPGVFTLGRPAVAAVRFALLTEFLRSMYLGLDGRSPTRVSSSAPGETFTAFLERVVLVLVGSFAAVVAVAWIDAIPLDTWGLVGTTAVAAACVGSFQLLGGAARWLPQRFRRWGRWLLSMLLLSAAATLVWRLATAEAGRRVAAALDTALFGSLWKFFPPARWVERTASVYAEFDRMLPATPWPFAALVGATVVYGLARWMDRRRRGVTR